MAESTLEKQEGMTIPSAAPPVPKKKTRKKKWIILVAVVLVAAAVLFQFIRGMGQRSGDMGGMYTYAQAERRDISATLSGSGALEAADSYTVTTLVAGDILSASFEEGDIVTKGDTLYEIDSSDASNSIERAEISLSQSQRNYYKKAESMSDLTVASSLGGTISGLTVKAGDTVSTQTPIAVIENTDILTLTEYYSDIYEGQIYAGMPATVSIPDQMLNLTGRVKEVTSLRRTSDTGVPCFAVTVEVTNIGSLSAGQAATCWLNGAEDIYPSISDADGLDASERTTIYAGVSGKVAQVLVHNGETVSAGNVLLYLSSDTLSDEIQDSADALRNSQLALQSQYDALDNYTITAPIDGTIVDKYFKEGEKSETGKALCIIYDLSSLSLILNVDELDISQVEVGQKATVTADAAPGAAYEGVITKVGINGTIAGGVTTYPVTIRIDKTDGLLPGMNVDVDIVTAQSENAFCIPADAVSRGNRVLVKTADGSTEDGAPDGYAYVEVTTGVSDDDYVEILSGLSEGDSVAYIPTVANPGDLFFFMQNGGMGGGQAVTATRVDGGPSGGAQAGNGPGSGAR